MKKQKTEHKTQNIKNNKGITLVALIITIVVLLILAAVAIGAAQESNIVGYAQNASTKYEQAQGNENNTITDMEALLNKYTSSETIPKLSDEEKEELLNLLKEYIDNKYANIGEPTEEQLAIANRAKEELFDKGLNLDEAIDISIKEHESNIHYFHDKKVVFNYAEGIVREVTVEEVEDFEELYKIAKVIDEKLEKGEYTIDSIGCYSFNYNGETIIFLYQAGRYAYEYNEEYTFYPSHTFPDGGCLGL